MASRPNVGHLDRLIRTVAGVILALSGWLVFTGSLRTVAYIFAALFIFTGLSGHCLLYSLLGISTHKPDSASPSDSDPSSRTSSPNKR